MAATILVQRFAVHHTERNQVDHGVTAPAVAIRLPTVRMAVAMRRAGEPLREIWARQGWDLGVAMGIHCGHATLGVIGVEGRVRSSRVDALSLECIQRPIATFDIPGLEGEWLARESAAAAARDPPDPGPPASRISRARARTPHRVSRRMIVTNSKGTGRHDFESLVEAGRRLVKASADIPREALEFLGRPRLGRRRRPPPGAVPGEMVVPRDALQPVLRVTSYGRDEIEEHSVSEVAALREMIGIPGRTAWIEVEGFGNRGLLEDLREILGIHPLAMADVVHVPQRPKAELHDGQLLAIAQMARVTDEGTVDLEQVSLVLGPGWVASFQERPGDVFDPVRARLREARTRIRQQGADYLLYALIDAVIDGYFPVVEALGGVIDALEEEVVEQASRACVARIHATRRTLLTLHRVQWRQLDAVNVMLRDEELPISPKLKPYLRDTHDHAFQTLDAVETYRDMVVGLMDLYVSSASHRMNEVMKTLTIVATIFIPLTFVAGVYGMNFDYMPELRWHWGYAAFWATMLSLGGGLLLWFRRRGWIGADPARTSELGR